MEIPGQELPAVVLCAICGVFFVRATLWLSLDLGRSIDRLPWALRLLVGKYDPASAPQTTRSRVLFAVVLISVLQVIPLLLFLDGGLYGIVVQAECGLFLLAELVWVWYLRSHLPTRANSAASEKHAPRASQWRCDDAFYAIPTTVSEILSFKDYDDRGSLEVSPDGIRFVGRKVNFTVRKVVAVSIVRQQIPWLTIAVVNVVVVAGLVAVWTATALDLSSLLPGLAILVAVNVVVILMHARDKWVKVDYEDEPSAGQSVCFADDSMRGWRGLFGGTKDLYRAIHDHRSVGDAPAAE
jgi:hypothetical protein